MELEGVLEEPGQYEGEDGGLDDGGDIGAALLSRLHNSHAEGHRHVCTVVGAMSQELKDQGFPLSPVAYFGATVSSLEELSKDPSCGADPVVSALVFFLSEVLPRMPQNLLRSRAGPVLETLGRVLMSGLLTESALEGSLRCVPHIIVVGGKDNWPSASPLYKIILEYVTDNRPVVSLISVKTSLKVSSSVVLSLAVLSIRLFMFISIDIFVASLSRRFALLGNLPCGEQLSFYLHFLSR